MQEILNHLLSPFLNNLYVMGYVQSHFSTISIILPRYSDTEKAKSQKNIHETEDLRI